MKLNKLYICLLFAVMALMPSCKYDDLQSDVDGLKDRVTLLEEQVKMLNDNMAVISYMFDGKIAIKKVEEGANSFTLTFTDDKTLTLSLGSASSVRLPDMKVENDEWVIEGVNTGISTKNDVPGMNGKTPLFKLELDGTNGKYYYTVSYDGGKQYEAVADENNEKIYVTVDAQLPSDPFFQTAGLSDDGQFFVLDYLKGGKLQLPIIEDLSCELMYPLGRQINVIAGTTTTVSAKIKGDHIVVTAPDNFEYEVGDPDQNGIVKIKLMAAPTNVYSSRVSADNSTDLVVMVNKGNYWAVDKMSVKAISASEATLPEKYLCGEDITLGGGNFNYVTNGEPLIVNEDITLNDADEHKYQVVFIGAGKTVTVTTYEWEKDKFRGYTNLNLVFTSLDKTKPGTVVIKENAALNLAQTETAAGRIVLQNIVFDVTEMPKRYPIVINNRIKPIYLNIDQCQLKMNATALSYLSATYYFDEFTVTNSDISYKAASGLNPFINIKDKIPAFGKITFNNNIFYSKGNGHVDNFQLLNVLADVKDFDIECVNNTFVGLEPRAKGLFNVKGIKNFKFNNNILWSQSDNMDNVILKYAGNDPSGSAAENISCNRPWKLSDKATLFEGAISKVANPFEGDGAQFDRANGIFKTNNTVTGKGATR